jgi:hypothetical protein
MAQKTVDTTGIVCQATFVQPYILNKQNQT